MHPYARLLAALATAALAACSASKPATAPPSTLFEAAKSWVSPEGRRHPLAGRVYDVAAGTMTSASAVVDAAAGADFVLLGEQHDNVDHHRLQNGLLRELLARGRRPAMAFEQVDLEKQPALDFALAEDSASSPTDRALRVAEAVGWAKSGWPPFDQYRPLFETALEAGLPLEAANLSRAKMHGLFAGAGKAPEDDPPGLLKLTDAQRSSMKEDIVDSHCGYAPDGMVTAMIEGQRRRDAEMARVLETSAALRAPDGKPRGAVLVCGFAHARKDYGVPAHLAAAAVAGRIVSVAFVEVFPSGKEPSDYAEALHAGSLPFDFVMFTPRVDDEDPCEKFRASLGKLKEQGAGHATPKPASTDSAAKPAAGEGAAKP